MANEYNNKIVLGDGTVLIDLSGDTADPAHVLSGYTFHDKSGAPVTGTCPYDSDTSEDTAAVAEILAGKTAHASVALYFWQYSCTASAVGNGVDAVSVSNSAPYEGDSVTFTAALKQGATWHGWYSDAACTQLVSTSQVYTTDAADLTLYAKATREVTGTGAYARAGGQWAEAQDVYKRINGEWVLQTDDSYKTEMQNGKYKFEEVSA